MRTSLLVIAMGAAGMLGGCDRPEHAAAATAAVQPSPVAAAGNSAGPLPDTPETNGDALVDANDRIIAENKRMIAMLGKYQSEDFVKYEALRKGCEARVQGTLADAAAPAVARCIEAGW